MIIPDLERKKHLLSLARSAASPTATDAVIREFQASASPQVVEALLHEIDTGNMLAEKPGTFAPVPSDDYETLKRQFNSLVMFAASKVKLCEYHQRVSLELNRVDRSQNAEEINAERDINSQLTNDLLDAELATERLQKENEILRAHAERYLALREEGFLDSWVSIHVCDEHQRPSRLDAAIDEAVVKGIART